MSQMVVDSSMGCAGIAQPQSSIKLAATIDKHSLVHTQWQCRRLYTALLVEASTGESSCATGLFTILTTLLWWVSLQTGKIVGNLISEASRRSGWSRDHQRAATRIVHGILCIFHGYNSFLVSPTRMRTISPLLSITIKSPKGYVVDSIRIGPSRLSFSHVFQLLRPCRRNISSTT